MFLFSRLRYLAAALLAVMLFVAPAARADQSPVFGSATVSAMSNEAAQEVTAKGYYANYFGSLALDASYTAYIYNYYARYYAASNSANEQNWYLAAMNNGYNAYIYSYYAYVYSYYGM